MALCAFLMAEAVAALEWLIHYYVVYIRKVDASVVGIILLFLIDGAFLTIVGMAEKRLLNRVNGFYITRKEILVTIVRTTTTAAIIPDNRLLIKSFLIL